MAVSERRLCWMPESQRGRVQSRGRVAELQLGREISFLLSVH